jgi:hypothetical protein
VSGLSRVGALYVGKISLRLAMTVVGAVARIERSEIRGRRDPQAKIPGFHGACHRARIRATRWFNPGYKKSFNAPVIWPGRPASRRQKFRFYLEANHRL